MELVCTCFHSTLFSFCGGYNYLIYLVLFSTFTEWKRAFKSGGREGLWSGLYETKRECVHSYMKPSGNSETCYIKTIFVRDGVLCSYIPNLVHLQAFFCKVCYCLGHSYNSFLLWLVFVYIYNYIYMSQSYVNRNIFSISVPGVIQLFPVILAYLNLLKFI